MCTTIIQQLLNILQAANVAAIQADQNCDRACRALINSLFLANGATFDGSWIGKPDIFVGDYLVFYDDHGVQAYLTRAQVEVLEDYFGTCDKDANDVGAQPNLPSPVGCCTDPSTNTTECNVPQSMCLLPKKWIQKPCPSSQIDKG
jgi:hypothetical protein